MIYPHVCRQCNHEWEVTKPVRDLDLSEFCPICQSVGKRVISKHQSFNGEKGWDPKYCPGLGTVIKSSTHRKKLIKERGLEEVGNEDLGKLDAQRERDLEKKIDHTLDEAAKEAYKGIT
jgi:hypothetical protein